MSPLQPLQLVPQWLSSLTVQSAHVPGQVVLDAIIHHNGTIGDVTVLRSTNDAFAPSGGQVKAGGAYEGRDDSPKLCVMEGHMQFELLDVGITAFNKEPIVLRHTITHIPPVGQGGGTGPVALNLYSTADPDGEPIAVLRQVKTHIGAWLNDAAPQEAAEKAYTTASA